MSSFKRPRVVPPFPLRTPFKDESQTSEGDASSSGVARPHIVFMQHIETSVNNSWQVASTIPAHSNSTGIAGTITGDGAFLYMCVAANVWKRVALASF